MSAQTKFTEAEILAELDLAFNNKPGKYFPPAVPTDVQHVFLFDLEHGYFETAGSRIHLYADSTRWAIACEKNGYANRSSCAEIEIVYFGNCINYVVENYTTYKSVSNLSMIPLIDLDEFARIENRDGDDMETFELIDKHTKTIKIRDQDVAFDADHRNYEAIGINMRSDDNPNSLIGFGDLIRYLQETNPTLISATDNELRQHIPIDIPHLLTIEKFHFESIYNKEIRPSQQETYRLLAKVLTTGNPAEWQPKKEANNSWKNWESGDL